MCDHVTEKDTLVHRHAFKSRIAFTHLTTSFENWDKFPYTTHDLAAYLLLRMDEIEKEDVKYEADE